MSVKFNTIASVPECNIQYIHNVVHNYSRQGETIVTSSYPYNIYLMYHLVLDVSVQSTVVVSSVSLGNSSKRGGGGFLAKMWW